MVMKLKKYLAIDEAKLVLPTPGGPTKHRIFPERSPFNFPTAMNSNILSFFQQKKEQSYSKIKF